MAPGRLPFAKMHGCANDYVVVDGVRREIAAPAALARRACDRRLGVGADGLLVAAPAAGADLAMHMYNPDGSPAQMCGNGLRCLVRYGIEEGLLDAAASGSVIATGAGPRRVRVLGRDPWDLEIDMGTPDFDPAALPARVAGPEALAHELALPVGPLRLTLVGLGNPHAVHFVPGPEAVAAADLARLGPAVERHPDFPERVNLEVVAVVAPDRLVQRTWERGAGETPACGTGACAALVAAARTGRSGREATVDLAGGALRVRWAADGHVFLRGPAERVFDGELRGDARDPRRVAPGARRAG